MWIYYTIFALTTLLGYLANKYNKANRKITRFILYVVLSIFVVFVGLRDVTVGSDSTNYAYYLESAKEMNLTLFLILHSTDIVFYTFTWLCSRLFSVNMYFFILAALYFAVFLKFIYNRSSNIGLSIWLVNSIGFTTFALSTLRQSVAIAFCLLAYMYFSRKRLWAFVYMLIACLCHVSAIIFMPILFIDKISGKKLPLLMTSILFFVLAFSSSIMNYLSSTLKDERYEMVEVGGLGMIIFLSFIIIVGLLVNNNKTIPRDYQFGLFAIFLALCSFILTRFNMAAMRAYYYYLAIIVIFIPDTYMCLSKRYKAVYLVSIIFITFFFLVYRVMSDPYEDSRLLLPYKLFWQ